ncbi:hypothetical protein [Planctomicrobium sp. SH664]|uniref:hypothetical protein n=1 Tax=Planctomicrobium sp. SH664 TaxID=3448125 RepID=UPI003F5C8321
MIASRWRAALGLFVLASGCGQDPYILVPVTGKVLTCEGKPAAGGTVMFMPVDNPSVTGRPQNEPGKVSEGVIGEDGTFTLWYGMTQGVGAPPPTESGAVTGPHRLMFKSPFTAKPTLSASEKAQMGEEDRKAAQALYDAVKIYPPIPCSLKVEPSEVIVELNGTNHFELKLAPR